MSAAKDIKAQVLARVNLERLYGLPQGRKRIACPIHGGDSKNFAHLKGGFFKCHSCGAGGDAITFVHLRDGGSGKPCGADYWKALEKLARQVGISIPEEMKESKERWEPALRNLKQSEAEAIEALAATETELSAFYDALVPISSDKRASVWCRKDRGFDPERVESTGACRVWAEAADKLAGSWARYGTKEKLWRSNGNRIVAPVYTAAGELVSFKFRNDGSIALVGDWAKGSKEVSAKGLHAKGCVMANATGLEMLRTGVLPEGCSLVVHVEGLPDLVAAAAYGPEAAVFGNVTSSSVSLGLVSRVPHGATVILAFDSDKGGAVHRKHALRAYAARSNELNLFTWFSNFKDVNDVNEHLKKGGCEGSILGPSNASITWANKRPVKEQTIRSAMFEDARPKVVVGTDLHRMTEEVSAILSTSPDVYVDPLNRLATLREESGVLRIHAMEKEEVDFRVSECARFIKREQDKNGNVIGEKESTPSMRVVGQVMNRGEYAEGRPLVAVLHAGTLRPDGTVASSPGYDAATRSYLKLRSPIPVPDKPTAKQVREALALLKAPYADFPFAAEANRSAVLAISMTIASRLAFEGPAPGALLSASTQGSGKTLAGETAIHIATGFPAPTTPHKERPEEMDKVILSALMAGKPAFFVDNVTTKLASDALAICLTSSTFEGRLLGKNEIATLPVKTSFVFSANNADIGADMLRRLYVVRIDPEVERPETRTGFKIPDLRDYVRAHRRELNGALLTLLRAYCQAGQPDQGLKPWGSYEEWSALVRGCLVWLGMPDPADTRAALMDGNYEAESELELLEGLLEFQKRNGGAWTVGEVFKHVRDSDTIFRTLRSAVEGLHPAGPDKITRQAFGKLLSARRSRVRSGHKLVSSIGRGKRQWWEVVAVTTTTLETTTTTTTDENQSENRGLDSSGGSGGSQPPTLTFNQSGNDYEQSDESSLSLSVKTPATTTTTTTKTKTSKNTDRSSGGSGGGSHFATTTTTTTTTVDDFLDDGWADPPLKSFISLDPKSESESS